MRIVLKTMYLSIYCGLSLIFLFFLLLMKNNDLNVLSTLELKLVLDVLVIVSYKYILERNEFFKKIHNIFFLVFCLFHIGIPFSNFFIGSGDGYFNNYISGWYYNVYTINSLSLVNVFILMYTALSSLRFVDRGEDKNLYIFKDPYLISIYKLILFSLVFFWILIVYFIFGIKEYSDIYQEGKAGLLEFFLIFVPSFISFSFLFLLTNKKSYIFSWIIFLIWAIFAFNLGIRGPVLFPLSIGLFITCKVYNYNISMLKFLFFFVIFCYMVSYKFFKRSNLDFDYINPFFALQEMGSSLRPLNETLVWMENGIYDFQYGITYFAPLERFFIKIFQLYELPLDINDNRLMNIAITQNAGPYGFSIIAESYINFGLIGVIILAISLSLYFNKIDNNINILLKNPFQIIFLIAIFFHIRQAFVGAWGVLLYLSIFYVLIYFTYRVGKKYVR